MTSGTHLDIDGAAARESAETLSSDDARTIEMERWLASHPEITASIVESREHPERLVTRPRTSLASA
jgi:hypothetical protein